MKKGDSGTTLAEIIVHQRVLKSYLLRPPGRRPAATRASVGPPPTEMTVRDSLRSAFSEGKGRVSKYVCWEGLAIFDEMSEE